MIGGSAKESLGVHNDCASASDWQWMDWKENV